MRVYELAEEVGLSSKDVITLLEEEWDVEVSNHMSGVDDETAEMLREYLADEPEADGVPPEEQSEPEPESDEEAEVPSEPEETGSEPPTEEAEDSAGEESERVLTVTRGITPEELADRLDEPANELIKSLIDLGVMATINQRLSEEAVELLAEERGFEVEFQEDEDEETQYYEEVELDENIDAEELEPRPPVITVMGHVDHGKTQLLDTLRETNVAGGESGGITQHIGAYKLEHPAGEFVFIDTPGHEAFTNLRARGAGVTDLVILVVAANDGVQPQTVESIHHAREADVPILVAINKMDLPDVDADRVRQQLSEHDLIPEEWGGETIMVEVSALEGDGIDELLEMIDLQAELLELTAAPNRPVRGTVIEAEMKQGMGPTATVINRQGTLKRGDPFVAGGTYGSVRALIDSFGERVDEMPPGEPVEVMGFDDLPTSGDQFKVVESESEARELADERADQRKADSQVDQKRVTMEQLQEFLEEGKVKHLNLLVKADTHGSVEVLQESFESVESDEVNARVIHTGVGGINESDVNLAEASDATIIGFNVSPDNRARKLASERGIEIRTYSVIYEAIEDVHAALEGMLAPEVEEQVIGRVEVRDVFDISGVGTIAGSYVDAGTVRRNARVRLIRDGAIVHDGEIDSLKRFQEDVNEVAEGYECGIGIEDYNDIKVGDELEIYERREVEATLS